MTLMEDHGCMHTRERPQVRLDHFEKLWKSFVLFMKANKATPEEFKRLSQRYYDEYIK